MLKHSVDFFDRQFRAAAGDTGSATTALNPFEAAILPYLAGRVLDLGCGLGNLACAAARKGCQVTAMDASLAAIDSLEQRSKTENLGIETHRADLADFRIDATYDAAVSIGLLMFVDCDRARNALAGLQACVHPGGIAAVNVLIVGTTFMDMFDPAEYCLFTANELEHCFAGWEVLLTDVRDFPGPKATIKRFSTIIARKPTLAAAG